MEYGNNTWLKGHVAPTGFKAPGTEQHVDFDTRNGVLISQISGQYAELVRQGKVFSASAAAITLPVTGASPTSLFSIYNPPGSTVNLELVEINVGTVLVTTVVDLVGLYYNTPAQTAAAIAANAPTAGTVRNALVNGANGQGVFYTSFILTTPTLARIIGGWGATSANGLNIVTKEFNGALIIPPGVSAHALMTTAASTGSGVTLDATWAEIPIV